METAIMTFSNQEFGELLSVNLDGQAWLCGRDIAKALGYKDTKSALADHVDEEDKRIVKGGDLPPLENHIPKAVLPINFVHGEIPNRGLTFINESGLYSLVMGSKLPGARRFKRWVTAEVLPTIRKTGGYVNEEDAFVRTYLPFAGEEVKQMFSSTLAALREANRKIEADKPKVLFADAVSAAHTSILVGELAKLLRQNGIDIGQNRLFQWLRENGYLIRRKGSDYNMPTQRAMDMGLFEIKETVINQSDGNVRVSKTTKVTGKGSQYFINQFLRSAR